MLTGLGPLPLLHVGPVDSVLVRDLAGSVKDKCLGATTLLLLLELVAVILGRLVEKLKGDSKAFRAVR